MHKVGPLWKEQHPAPAHSVSLEVAGDGTPYMVCYTCGVIVTIAETYATAKEYHDAHPKRVKG